MKSIKSIIFILLLLPISSCLKQKNELPPMLENIDPALEINFTIAKLNKLLPPEGAPIAIDSDWTIAAIVSADDESGNIYNQLIVQDSSGGIAFLLNDNSLFNRYPIGRKLYIKLKGLVLGNYHGTPQLGTVAVPDNSGILQVSDIAAKNFSKHIISANKNEVLVPISVPMSELVAVRRDLINRLITVEETELNNPNFDNQYADIAAASSVKIQNCSGAKMVLRTSNYARFQSATTPWGKGKITGIYSVYNGAAQLMIRDTSDVRMTDKRCDGTVQSVPYLLTIDSLRKMYQTKDTLIRNYKIRAVVTSDIVNNNFGGTTIVIQNGGKGLLVYFGSSASGLPNMGDSIELNIVGSTLTKYAGALELKNIKTTKITVLARNKNIAAVPITIAALNANFDAYESVLVKILNAKITNSGNYNGSKTLDDGTGTITLYTNSTATFANTAAPTITKTFQGIATPYNATKEIKIRNPSVDVY